MIRLRKSEDVIPHGVVGLVPLDQEAFFAARHVGRQSAIRKSEFVHRAQFIHNVNDPAGVKPPQPDGTPEHRHDLPRLNWGIRRPRLDPTQPEMLPSLQGGSRGMKRLLTLAKLDAGVVDDVPARRCTCGGSHRRVGEVARGLLGQELTNRFSGWLP